MILKKGPTDRPLFLAEEGGSDFSIWQQPWRRAVAELKSVPPSSDWVIILSQISSVTFTVNRDFQTWE